MVGREVEIESGGHGRRRGGQNQGQDGDQVMLGTQECLVWTLGASSIEPMQHLEQLGGSFLLAKDEVGAGLSHPSVSGG